MVDRKGSVEGGRERERERERESAIVEKEATGRDVKRLHVTYT
jgi:hypothetical protein